MKLKPRTTTLNPRALLYRRYINLQDSNSLDAIYCTADGRRWLFDKEHIKFNLITEWPENPNLIYTYERSSPFNPIPLKFENHYFHYRFSLIYDNLDGVGEWIESNIGYTDVYSTYNTTITSSSMITGLVVSPEHTELGDVVTIINYYPKKIFLNGFYITDKNHYYFFGNFELEPNESVTRKAIEVRDVEHPICGYYFNLQADISEGNIMGAMRFITQKPDENYLAARFANIGKYQTNKYYYVGSFDYVLKGSVSGSTTQYIKGNIIPITSMNIQYFNDYINIQPDDLVVIKNRLYSVENPEADHKYQPRDYTVYSVTLNSIL